MKLKWPFEKNQKKNQKKKLKKSPLFYLLVAVAILNYQNCDNVKLSLVTAAPLATTTGMVCAQSPSTLQQLNRFIFMFQNTGSMVGLDPGTPAAPTRRVTALANFINEHQSDPNFTIAIGSLTTNAAGFLPDPAPPALPLLPNPQPNCTFFSPSNSVDAAALPNVLAQLETEAEGSAGSSQYAAIFNELQSCVQADIAANQSAQYNVILVIDGSQNDETIATLQSQVSALVQLGVPSGSTSGNLNLFLANLDSYNDSGDATTNLNDMVNSAHTAGGLQSRAVTYPVSSPISYDSLGVINTPNYRIQQLVVTNMNAAVEADGTQGPDSDSDGLPDDIDPYPADYTGSSMHAYNQYLANPTSSASPPAAGCGDLVYQKNQQSCPSSCNANLRYVDTDQDGLSDCDESIIGSNIFSVDTDGDGMPDDLEYKLGLSPISAADRNLDPDGDGVTNYQEVMRLTSPYINDNNVNHKTFQSVSIQEFQQSNGTYCYNIGVTGLQVFPTQAVQMQTVPQLLHQKNENIIRFLFFEVPDNQPGASPVILQAYKSVLYDPTSSGLVNISNLTTTDFGFMSGTGN